MPSIRSSARSAYRLSLFVTLALVACSDGGGGSGALAALGIDDGASAGLTKSANASADKGVRITLGTGALVEIPAGAVTKEVKVSLERPDDGKALELVNRLAKAEERIASAPYVLTPHGTKFQSDVTVKLPLAKKDASAVSVAWLEDEDDKEWKVLGEAEIEGDKASVKLKHFSVLLLIEDASDLPPLDAGSASPDEDAGEADGAGAEPRDADVEDDAEGPDELDAGTHERDASDGEFDASTGDPEAGTRSDSAAADAEPPDATAAPTTLLAKLSACGLVAQQGFLSEPMISDPVSHCHYHCLLAGPCGDAQGFYCYGGDIAYSTETQDCFASCGPTYFVCPDQTQGYFQCDGFLDCTDGEDEAGCEPSYVQCASQRVASHLRCNGVFDCPAGEDEQGCPWHVCDGDVTLPPDFVCDGYADCLDGSDEPASCASIVCDTPAARQ